MDPIKFPPRDVPIIGQQLAVHPGWVLIAPITCNCDAKTPLTVKFGQGLAPEVCPACMNVYGVVRIQYHPARNVGFQMEIGLIGKAQRQVSEADVENTTKQILETVN